MYCLRILFPLLSCFKGNFNKLQVFCPTLQKETIFSTVFLVEGGWGVGGGEGWATTPLPLRYLRPCPKITVMYTATKTPQPPVFGRSFLVIWEFYGNNSGPSLFQLIAWNKVERCSEDSYNICLINLRSGSSSSLFVKEHLISEM